MAPTTKAKNQTAKGKRPTKATGKGVGGQNATLKKPPAKQLPAAEDIRIVAPLVIGLIGLIIAGYGFAVLDQTLQVAIARGRDSISEPAKALFGMMLGASLGLILAALIAARMKPVIGIITALVIIGTLSFGGKTAVPGVINQLAATTTPLERQTALRAQFLHQSLAASAFRSDTLPSNPADMDTHAFMAGIGALGTIDPSVYQRLDGNLDTLATAILARSLDEASAWRKFQEAVAETGRDYERYRIAANTYRETLGSLNQRADQLWQAVIQSARARWASYQQRRDEALRQLNNRIPAFRDMLAVYFQVHQRGGNTAEMDRRYEAFTNELFGQYVDPQIWCGRRGCPGDQEFVANAGAAALSSSFLEQFNGLALNLTEGEFIAHPNVVTALRSEVAAEGVMLPESWALSASGRDMLLTAAIRDLPVEAEKRYNSAVNEWFGVALAPDLSYADFIAQEGIQQGLRRSLQLPGDLRIDPNIDEATFRTDLYPRIERRPVDALAGDMQAPLDDFENGARLAATAQSSIELLFALPLALFAAGLAALSGTIIGAGLSVTAIWHMVARILKLGVAPVIKANRVIRLTVIGLFIICLTTPMIISQGVARYPGYSAILQPAIMVNPMLGIPSSWIMRTAPGLQPTGAMIRVVAFGNDEFGLRPIISEREDGFGFIFDGDASGPELLNEQPQGPAGITGIKDRIEGLIDRTTNSDGASGN